MRTNMVVEFRDAVGVRVRIEMQWQIRNPAFVLVTKPGRLIHLLTYFGNQLQIRLDFPLEAVERVLEFYGQPFGKVVATPRTA